MKSLNPGTIATLALSFFLMALQPELRATHYMGGEITWECTPQGNFRFTMILYRECYTTSGGSAATFAQTLNMQTNVPGFATIQMNRISLEDMSPQCSCPGGPNIYCPGMPAGAANMGAMQQNVYTSDQAYPNGVPLTGVPPATGWFFSYGGCCRNPCHNIQNAQSLQFVLRAVMYPYQSTPVNTCFDNSPSFLERPSTVICSGYPWTYNHLAFDKDLDSLVYEWAEPLDSNINSPITNYFPGYSFNHPLPGTMLNPSNVPATLNPVTGEIAFTSYTNGAFVTVIKVTAYKAKIKVAEVFREIQVVLLSCGLNTPPNLTPPFQNNIGHYTLYQDTVHAGQHVTFTLSGTNFTYCPNTSPPVPQTISLWAVGGQFGAPINPGGCHNPPCATLTPSPTWQNPLLGTFGVQTVFNWQTECQHLATVVGSGTTSNVYNFLIKLMDNFCPAPGIRYATVTIVVINKPTIPSPPIECLEVLPNGDVMLSWSAVYDTMGFFGSYQLRAATNPAGPFTVIDSISDINTTSTIHTGADAHNRKMYYYLSVQSGCGEEGMAAPYDTAQAIHLYVYSPGTGIANLSWNATHTPSLPNGSGWYMIFRDDGSGSWALIDSTTSLNYSDTTIFHNQPVSYRIETAVNTPGTATTQCRSISNQVTALLNSTPELPRAEEGTPFIFPNPSKNEFVLNPGYLSGPASLTIKTLNGVTVKEQQLVIAAGTPSTIHTPGLPAGAYLVHVSDKTRTFSTKLIIQ